MKYIGYILLALYVVSCQTKNTEALLQNDKIPKIKNYLEELSPGNKFSGIVLIAQNDSILFQKAHGFEGNEKKIRNTIQSKFEIASIPKMFTALSIMQLKEKGKLSLDAPIAEYINEYPDKINGDSVTIRQLLSHTSGLDNPTGKGFYYSNSGFILLGKIIEEGTDKGYFDYVRRNILEPAGMDNTYYNTISRDVNISEIEGGGAGGGKSTAHDLLKFVKLLKEFRLVNKENLEAMTTDHTGQGYGYGFTITERNGHAFYGHRGGAPNASGAVEILDSKGYVVVILTNREATYGGRQMRNYILDVLANAGTTLDTIKKPEVKTQLASFPIDFESNSIHYNLVTWGAATAEITENPDRKGNPSTKTAKLEKPKGAEEWAGTFLDLTNPIDFTQVKTISIDVWSPRKDTNVRLKLENSSNPDVFFELEQNSVSPKAWETLEFDLTDKDLGQGFNRVVLFFEGGKKEKA